MPKNWEATDLKMGELSLRKTTITETDPDTGETTDYPAIQVERVYQFLDSNGEILGDISSRRITVEKKLTDIPQDILDALSVIDNFTYDQAKEKEGL